MSGDERWVVDGKGGFNLDRMIAADNAGLLNPWGFGRLDDGANGPFTEGWVKGYSEAANRFLDEDAARFGLEKRGGEL